MFLRRFLHVVPIREHTVHDGSSASPQTQHSNRSHQGVRGRPRKSTTRVYSEVATPRGEQHTFEQRHLEPKWLEPKWLRRGSSRTSSQLCAYSAPQHTGPGPRLANVGLHAAQSPEPKHRSRSCGAHECSVAANPMMNVMSSGRAICDTPMRELSSSLARMYSRPGTNMTCMARDPCHPSLVALLATHPSSHFCQIWSLHGHHCAAHTHSKPPPSTWTDAPVHCKSVGEMT